MDFPTSSISAVPHLSGDLHEGAALKRIYLLSTALLCLLLLLLIGMLGTWMFLHHKQSAGASGEVSQKEDLMRLEAKLDQLRFLMDKQRDLQPSGAQKGAVESGSGLQRVEGAITSLEKQIHAIQQQGDRIAEEQKALGKKIDTSFKKKDASGDYTRELLQEVYKLLISARVHITQVRGMLLKKCTCKDTDE